MDKIGRIGIFIEVAKQQSFSGAARALGMSAPAVSKQIQALEDQLNVKLFNRTTRHVSLTEEGALYASRTEKALDDLREAENQLHEMKACPVGQLKVSAPQAFGARCLAAPIAEFAAQYPNIDLEVDFDDRHVDILNEGYDVVLRIAHLTDSGLIARKLAPCPILLCASPAFIAAHGMPQTPDDIAKMRAIVYNRNHVQSVWGYKAPDGRVGQVQLQKNFTANNADMLLEACRQGLGVAIIPVFAAGDPVKNGELVQLLPDYMTFPERNFYAVFPPNRHLSTRVRLFIDHMTEAAKHLPWAV